MLRGREAISCEREVKRVCKRGRCVKLNPHLSLAHPLWEQVGTRSAGSLPETCSWWGWHRENATSVALNTSLSRVDNKKLFFIYTDTYLMRNTFKHRGQNLGFTHCLLPPVLLVQCYRVRNLLQYATWGEEKRVLWGVYSVCENIEVVLTHCKVNKSISH